MSYAIFTVFYGVPLVINNGGGRSASLEEFVESEPNGVYTKYSGSADETPAAFGVPIGQFNECCHHVELRELQLVPTAKQKSEFFALFEALSPSDTAMLNELGEPRVFFLVSTS